MGFENTSLVEEVKAIFDSKNRIQTAHRWRAELKVRGQKDPIPNLRVLSVDTFRDYVGAYADELVVEMVLGGGTFAYDVVPKRDQLTITLFRDPVDPTSSDPDLTQDINSQTFTAVLINASAAALEANDLRMQSKETGDITTLKTVRFQLVDQALEQIRMQSVGGAFRDTTVAEVLKYMLTKVSADVDVDDENKIKGVEMFPPHNTTPNKHIVLPHGLRFTDMPEYLTQRCAGIYNSGFGVYLQKHTWHVFPSHDLTRYKKSTRGLTLINVPKNKYPQVEKTFRRTPNQVIAMVTGDVQHLDPTEINQLNEGNGIRFTDARQMFRGMATTENNRTVISRGDNNHEYLSDERKNGLNNVHLSPRRITSNVFAELSRMAPRKGCYVNVVWENSDPGLIEPGMPVKFLYAVKNEVKEAYGCVTQVHNHTGTSQPGFAASRHLTNSALQLFLESNLSWDDSEEKTT